MDNKIATVSNQKTNEILKTGSYRVPLMEYKPGFLEAEDITYKLSIEERRVELITQKLTLDNIYDDQNTFYPYFTPIIAASNKQQVFYMATPYGKTIYQMSLGSNNWEVFMEDVQLVGLNKPNGVPFSEQNKNINPMFGMTEKEMIYVESNGRILRIFTSENRLAIVHKTSFPEKNIPNTSKNIYSLSKKYQSIYLSVFEGKKKIFESDISQYPNWKNMLMLNDSTFLMEKVPEEDIEPNETTFELLTITP
ncbi:MAG: hypothetical protein HWE21_08245 [Cytophagia bacterium]|nr:hypothetical protein [Cytophagia bacterium]